MEERQEVEEWIGTSEDEGGGEEEEEEEEGTFVATDAYEGDEEEGENGGGIEISTSPAAWKVQRPTHARTHARRE